MDSRFSTAGCEKPARNSAENLTQPRQRVDQCLAVMVGSSPCQDLMQDSSGRSTESSDQNVTFVGARLRRATSEPPSSHPVRRSRVSDFPCRTLASSVAVKDVTIHGMVVRHVN